MSRSGDPARDAVPPGSGPPLVEIARQIRAGSGSAWRDFHDRLATWVSWHVRRRFSRKLRQRFEPTDLVQATWLRIVQHLPRLELRDDSSLLAWIVQVVENGATDLERHMSKLRRDVTREVALAPFLIDDGGEASAGQHAARAATESATLPAALRSATASHVDRFWLDGPLAISAAEQVTFLRRLQRGTLPVDRRAAAEVRDALVLGREGCAVLHGTTGYVFTTTPRAGWWVGWVDRGASSWTFALNLDVTAPEHLAARTAIGRSVLREVGALDPDASC